jgi:SMC interacting uncharacterized protein involved in chromosome segregation
VLGAAEDTPFNPEASEDSRQFFDYLTTSYRTFLAGDDETYHRMEEEQAKRCEERNKILRGECTDLERANEELRQQIELAKSAKVRTLMSNSSPLSTRLTHYGSQIE